MFLNCQINGSKCLWPDDSGGLGVEGKPDRIYRSFLILKLMKTYNHKIEWNDVWSLTDEIYQVLDGHPAPLCEQALVWAYIHVAGGVREFPEQLRDERMAHVFATGLSALVHCIQETAAMTETELLAWQQRQLSNVAGVVQ